jgi:hypothetical protein
LLDSGLVQLPELDRWLPKLLPIWAVAFVAGFVLFALR